MVEDVAAAVGSEVATVARAVALNAEDVGGWEGGVGGGDVGGEKWS